MAKSAQERGGKKTRRIASLEMTVRWDGGRNDGRGGEEVLLDNACSLIEGQSAEKGIPILRGDEGWGCVGPWSYTNWD